MTIRQRIQFEDIFENLWSQAYAEIGSIVKALNLLGHIIILENAGEDIIGIYVGSDETLCFIDSGNKLRFAEEFDDYVMFEAYRTLYDQYYGA